MNYKFMGNCTLIQSHSLCGSLSLMAFLWLFFSFLIRWSIFCTFLNFIILKHTSITHTHTAASTLDFNRVYCQLSSRNIIISSLLSYLWSKLTHSDSFVCNIKFIINANGWMAFCKNLNLLMTYLWIFLKIKKLKI